MLKYFRGTPLKIYLHEYLTHEYFHTRKFPDLWYLNGGTMQYQQYVMKQLDFIIKDHIVMHAILFKLKWLYSLVP